MRALQDLAEESDEIIAVGIYNQGRYNRYGSRVLTPIYIAEDGMTAQHKADSLMTKLMEHHQGAKVRMSADTQSVVINRVFGFCCLD